jgi:hypothetical protein
LIFRPDPAIGHGELTLFCKPAPLIPSLNGNRVPLAALFTNNYHQEILI